MAYVRADSVEDTPPTLLVVDDDALVIATFAEGLRKFGYSVREASNAGEALACVREHQVDLAIVDVRMPGRSGIELATELREHFSVPSLFLTAYSEDELVHEAVAAGALGYMVKPIDVTRALPQVRASLARAAELKATTEQRDNLERVLDRKRVISLAVGMIVERKQLSQDAAFEWLRHQARSRRVRLEDLATELCNHADALNRAFEG